jgi:3-keto-disaccharide hydrolase
MHRILILALPLCAALILTAAPADAQKKGAYVSIFDGKSLKGWHVSAQSGHSRTSKNKTGGKWVVKDGIITGTQDQPGNGGLIITDKKYKNFEVVLEMKNDFGLDSGLFLRSTENGKAYQAMIDYYTGGNLMGIYGEGLGGFHYRNYSFLDSPDKITADIKGKDKGPTPLPVSPEKWPTFWKTGKWNELKASIQGNPPTVKTWINGVKFMEWTDTKKRLPDDGGIALQVHGGAPDRFFGKTVRYRKIRVKVLD